MEFSELPEFIFILIVAWLPLADALRLCSLSKQWLNLWVHSKTIEFDQSKFLIEPELLSRRRRGRGRAALMARRRFFIDYVLGILPRLVEPELDCFKLKYSYMARDKAFIEQLLDFTVSKKVKELHLDFRDETTLQTFHHSWGQRDLNALRSVFHVPCSLYNNTSLKVLSLGCCSLKYFNFQCFMDLSSVSLKGMLVTNEIVQNLETNCSLLEELILVDCRMGDDLIVSSAWLNLKRFVVNSSGPVLQGMGIFAPTLEYIEITGFITSLILGKLENLVEVVFDFANRPKSSYGAINLIDLLLGINWAKILTLTHHFLKVLPSDEDKYLELPLLMRNLEHLRVKTNLEGDSLSGTLCFLRSSPNLKSLSIHTEHDHDDSFTHVNPFPEYVREMRKTYKPCRFPLSSLRAIKLVGFLGNDDQMNLLEFLMGNVEGLEKVFIFFPRRYILPNDEIATLIKWAVQEIEEFEYASHSEVEVVFHTNDEVRSYLEN